MKLNNLITQSELREMLDYDQSTGEFVWKINKRYGYKGRTAGSHVRTGYVQIIINKEHYLAHRLAWLYVNGEFPPDQIDHINHVRNDNRIKNLRTVSCKENQKNKLMHKNNTSGVIGVHWYKPRMKWKAGIKVNGELNHLGYFTSLREAAKARKEAERKYGFHENHGCLSL